MTGQTEEHPSRMDWNEITVSLSSKSFKFLSDMKISVSWRLDSVGNKMQIVLYKFYLLLKSI